MRTAQRCVRNGEPVERENEMSRGDEPAYPVRNEEVTINRGMTIRERFAMAAMQGILSNPDCDYDHGDLSTACWNIAEIMLAEPEKRDE